MPNRAMLVSPLGVRSSVTLEEQALSLLLRSPRLSLSQILELLDVGDAEFRAIAARNNSVANLLEARKEGTLQSEAPAARRCPSCTDWFVPYGSARFCSDPCKSIGRLKRAI
jgi:hypothetical protein